MKYESLNMHHYMDSDQDSPSIYYRFMGFSMYKRIQDVAFDTMGQYGCYSVMNYL